MDQTTKMPQRIGEISIYPDPEQPGAYLYLPGAPEPERGPGGRPTLTLWMRGNEGGLLQLGTRWQVSEARLDEVRSALRREAGREVALRPAPVTIDSVDLEVADEGGSTTRLAGSTSSGYPPFTALFSTTVTAAQRARASEALSGTSGRLAVTYRGHLTSRVPVTATIEGDATEDLAAVGRDASVEAARAQVEEALAAGRLTASVDSPGDVPAALREQVAAEALELAARLLRARSAEAPAPEARRAARFTVTASRTATHPLPFRRSADVAAWFGAGEGIDHIQALA